MIFQRLRIISGGQSGVDRAALDFALSYGIQCGGWCPTGRLAEDGIIPDKYPLKESITSNYEERSKLNVRDSDGTIIIYENEMDKGTKLTLDIATGMSKPLMTINLHYEQTYVEGQIREWLSKYKISVLNVAGPRESSSPGIYRLTTKFLEKLQIEN